MLNSMTRVVLKEFLDILTKIPVIDYTICKMICDGSYHKPVECYLVQSSGGESYGRRS